MNVNSLNDLTKRESIKHVEPQVVGARIELPRHV